MGSLRPIMSRLLLNRASISLYWTANHARSLQSKRRGKSQIRRMSRTRYFPISRTSDSRSGYGRERDPGDHAAELISLSNSNPLDSVQLCRCTALFLREEYARKIAIEPSRRTVHRGFLQWSCSSTIPIRKGILSWILRCLRYVTEDFNENERNFRERVDLKRSLIFWMQWSQRRNMQGQIFSCCSTFVEKLILFIYQISRMRTNNAIGLAIGGAIANDHAEAKERAPSRGASAPRVFCGIW